MQGPATLQKRFLLILAFALAVAAQHDHGHSHHGEVKSEWDEEGYLKLHPPTPPSYWSEDMKMQMSSEEASPTTRYPWLMVLHTLFMCGAFFVALPAGIALRSVGSSFHALSVVVLYVLVALGLSSSALYRKLSPDLYEGNVHGALGYIVLFLAGALSALDVIALGSRLVTFSRAIRSGDRTFTFASLWKSAILGKDTSRLGSSAEYTTLVVDVDEEDEYEETELKGVITHSDQTRQPQGSRSPHKAVSLDEEYNTQTIEWSPQAPASDHTAVSGGYRYHVRHNSVHSDDTLQDVVAQMNEQKPWYREVGSAVFATLERILVFAGFVQLLTGVVVYTGGCRGEHINICLAHLIKGGIFWCYGLVTFARFLGSFSELGWAWNRIPVSHRKNVPTVEFVESFVIFLYGISNTWMERFGAEPGDPYTTRQVQHISIAVMFWFAGLVGMGLESKRFRRWLAAGSLASQYEHNKNRATRGQDSVAEPPSYVASFNPFPAICIGTTGIAMAAHFQPYVFQVQIHALWGNLLAGFAVMRCLTYFFLWLGPPRSTLPSRPPTEALAGFFLACGGLVFMFSTSELTVAAMRQGRDDIMMVACLAVAITCFALTWVMAVVSFKGWLKSRTIPYVGFHSSA